MPLPWSAPQAVSHIATSYAMGQQVSIVRTIAQGRELWAEASPGEQQQ